MIKIVSAVATGVAASVFLLMGQVAQSAPELPTGTQADAAVAWYVGRSDADRAADCRAAEGPGGMTAVVESDRAEALRDDFANGDQVVTWTVAMGRANCAAVGFTVR